MNQLTLDKFEEAYERVQEVILPTNLIKSDFFSETTGNKVYLKPENLQLTGAYKIRGAYYKISTLSEEEKQKGLITASAGNHAQGVAYAAKMFGVPATIVMPVSTPLLKVNRTKNLGAEVILHGNVYDEACEKALELAAEHGYTFVHPFDDLDVATGQGSIAMEIVKELPTVDTILVPVGGGGLATGVSTLAKMLNPKIRVIGVEPAGANCLQTSLREGKVMTLDKVDTIADGTAVKTRGETFSHTCRRILTTLSPSGTMSSSSRFWMCWKITSSWWRTPVCSLWRLLSICLRKTRKWFRFLAAATWISSPCPPWCKTV